MARGEPLPQVEMPCITIEIENGSDAAAVALTKIIVKTQKVEIAQMEQPQGELRRRGGARMTKGPRLVRLLSRGAELRTGLSAAGRAEHHRLHDRHS